MSARIVSVLGWGAACHALIALLGLAFGASPRAAFSVAAVGLLYFAVGMWARRVPEQPFPLVRRRSGDSEAPTVRSPPPWEAR